MIESHALLQTEPFPVDTVAATLAQRGWCVTDDFLPEHLVATLREETLRDWHAGDFRHAGVGRGESFEINPSIRTDQVKWLSPADTSLAQRHYLEQLERLRCTLNQHLYLGLFEYEGHLALYPAGTYYRKHLDQFRGIGSRTVTAILYLNEDWTAADGGALRIYTDATRPEHYETILPLGGRLVTFLSADYLHEVLPARRERLSITGWFRRRVDAA